MEYRTSAWPQSAALTHIRLCHRHLLSDLRASDVHLTSITRSGSPQTYIQTIQLYHCLPNLRMLRYTSNTFPNRARYEARSIITRTYTRMVPDTARLERPFSACGVKDLDFSHMTAISPR